ncbi:MAG: LysR family transcriptional regulator [Hasllibacter sp.]
MDRGFDWNHARTFLAVIEAGSLSGAARRLGLTQPTAGRQVAAFEAALGVVLFERHGRSLHPTDAAREMAARVREMEVAASHAALTAAAHGGSVEGLVRIIASEMYAAHLVVPLLPALRRAHPGLGIEVIAANERTDLLRREADIAIRNVRPEEEGLIARRLPDDRGAFFATPGWIARRGPIAGPADLSGRDFIGFGPAEPRYEGMLAGLGVREPEGIREMGSASHAVHWEMTRAGLGIGIGACWIGGRDPALVRVFPEMEPVAFPVWLIAPEELRASRRLRTVFDHLAAALAVGPPGTENAGRAA